VLPSDGLERIPSKPAAASRSAPQLPVYVEPAPEEALISWLLRLAARLKISTKVLAQAFQIPARADHSQWWRRPTPGLFQQISSRTGVRVERLRSMTFSAWTPVIHEDESSARLSGLWFADRPLYRRTHRLAVCARCLAEGSVPYLRLSWMIGWMAVCPRHQTLLLTQCPGCQVSLRLPPSASTRAFSSGCCHRCGAALINVGSPQAHPWVLRLQAVLLAAKREGATELEGIGHLSWQELLALADILSEMVWTAIGTGERHSLLRRIGYQMNTPLIQTPRNWNDRYGSLALLAGLLEGWPHSATARIARELLTRWLARPNGAFDHGIGPYLPRRNPDEPDPCPTNHPRPPLPRQGWSLDERVRALLRLLGDTPTRAFNTGAHLKPWRQPISALSSRIRATAFTISGPSSRITRHR